MSQHSSIELAAATLADLGARLSWEMDDDHSRRVGQYAQLLGLQLGLSALEAAEIGSAAAFHDIGKIGLPESLLRKPAPLDAAEWEIVKKHPLIGASLLDGAATSLVSLARLIALTHHEHWDGSGYPNGLKGESIPLAGRLTMLVDRYDALRSRRSYKAPFSHKRTCDILLQGDGRSKPEHFDPRLLAAFSECQNEFCGIQRTVSRTSPKLSGDLRLFQCIMCKENQNLKPRGAPAWAASRPGPGMPVKQLCEATYEIGTETGLRSQGLS
jgi:response regulator RpfG family c-di-GMP phosphodiesterase